jgi:hypothetical protein
LELETKKARAFEGNESLIEEARRKHPGYEFIVRSGVSDGALGGSGLPSVKRGAHEIIARITDPSLVRERPGGTITFTGEGANKAREFEKTGKPQTWNPGEFRIKKWRGPLMPSEFPEGTVLSVGSQVRATKPRIVRLEIGTAPAVIFPLMELRPIRAGTHEAQLELSADDVPLTINIVLERSGSSKVHLEFSWELSGHRASECGKLVKAIDALRLGARLRVFDIQMDKVVFETDGTQRISCDPFPGEFRRRLLLIVQIEERFSVALRMPDSVSDEDHSSLFHLDCLLNGTEYELIPEGTIATAQLIKAEGEHAKTQEQIFRGAALSLTNAPSNYPGFFQLFGQRISTPEWCRRVDCVATGGESELELFMAAAPGTEFPIELKATGPTHLQWKEESVSLLPANSPTNIAGCPIQA